MQNAENANIGNANLLIKGNSPKGANREIGVPRGWHSRGYLPHFDGTGVTQHVTFHLGDSLPKRVVEQLGQEIKAVSPGKQDSERRRRIEALLDAGYGSCVLREPAVAAMVQAALWHFDSERYRLLAWVIMPNHVHVLFNPINNWALGKIVASWKKWTASQIRVCQKTGDDNCGKTNPGNANLLIGAHPERVWCREYWDRFIRDDRHFGIVLDYIHGNPVKAGLVARAEEWPWSSAFQNANHEIGDPVHFKMPIRRLAIPCGGEE